MSSRSRHTVGRRPVAWSVVAGLAVVLLWAGPAGAGEARQEVRLTIDAPQQAVQGEHFEATISLVDQRGRPIVGATVVVLEEIRFFDYVDFRTVGLLRTGSQGTVTVALTPRAPGLSSLRVEFAGTEEFGAALATASLTVASGTAVVTHLTPVIADSILPRGVTAVWFLVLLIGVWLALAAAMYQLARIPREGVVSGGGA
jgi:hypothetical protein